MLLALFLNEWRHSRATDNLIDRIIQTLRDQTEANLEKVIASNDYRRELVRDLSRQEHIVTKLSLNDVPFDINNDQAIEDFMLKSIIRSFGDYPETVEVIRSEGQRYLRVNENLARIAVEDDTVTIYGDGNIQLRTADISRVC